MSSAILYLAIVAIWACVLIPRWLRRDSARSAVTVHGAPAPDAELTGAEPAYEAHLPDAEVAEPETIEGGWHRPSPVPLTAEESRRRMLKARRRLLGMLLVLVAAATSLAVVGLAAGWVIAPPAVMLAGYLLLLREASKADAERAAWEGERAGHANRAAQARDRQREKKAGELAEQPAVVVPAEARAEQVAARFAAAPVAGDYVEGGRDFAPGLAGKYTTSHEDYAYSDRRLRAVGD